MGYPDLLVLLPGPRDQALAESIGRIAFGDPLDQQELIGLLTNGTGRPGQLTASAWIVDPTKRYTLLVRHRRLGWSNPGGHVEPGETPFDTAVRETFEETGIRLPALIDDPVSLHCHAIPAFPDQPEHLHWNLGYSFVASRLDVPVAEPGQPVEWWPVDRLPDDRVDDLQAGVDRILGRTV